GAFMEELEVTPEAVRLDRLNNGRLRRNTQSAGKLGDVVGVDERARLERGAGHALVRFSKPEDVDTIFHDVRDGILLNISVSY
ncbi:prohead protease/major capsid protein fusion protein, partial [Pseudomonas aeruginosa]